MARKDGRAQRIAIIVIGIIFLATSIGGIIVTLSQSDQQDDQQQQLQDLLKQQQQAQTPAKKVEGAYIPKSQVTKLEITDLKTGSGRAAKASDTITVDYQGTLPDGTLFDSSYERGQPATFALSGVIEGWQKGIPGMKIGGKRRLVIPPAQAYGESGTADGSVPPNSALVFEIELKAIGGGR